MAVSDWSATADENTAINGIDISEHCPAKNMNDALRAVMASLKTKCDALDATDNTLRRGAVIGEIRWFAMSTPPEGWLVCNGAAVGRATYPELFAAIGTIYGTGDGSTTFNLPNLVDKFVEGSATAGTVKSAGLPNITGTLSKSGDAAGYFQVFDGAFYADSQSNRHSLLNANDTYFLANGGKFDASRCSSIYGNSTTVQPPALCLLPCIRYE